MGSEMCIRDRVQMQDCLGLGAEGRMNTPGTAKGNWRWRLLRGEASPALAKKLSQYGRMYGRIGRIQGENSYG